MLYTNKTIKTKTEQMSWGALDFVGLGEEGRGRKLLRLPCPSGFELEHSVVQRGYSIGATKSGAPRINRGEDGKLYMILDSSGGYTRRGDGVIYSADPSKVSGICKGWGADGAAGNIGQWSAGIVEARAGAVIRVRIAGGQPSEIFYVREDLSVVYACGFDDAKHMADAEGFELPSKEFTDWHPMQWGSAAK
jgi:hypothetical protein